MSSFLVVHYIARPCYPAASGPTALPNNPSMWSQLLIVTVQVGGANRLGDSRTTPASLHMAICLQCCGLRMTPQAPVFEHAVPAGSWKTVDPLEGGA